MCLLVGSSSLTFFILSYLFNLSGDMNFLTINCAIELSNNKMAFADPMILVDQDLMIALLCFVTKYALLKFRFFNNLLLFSSNFFLFSRSCIELGECYCFLFRSSHCACSVQCEKEYHVGCMKDHNMCDLKVTAF